jgi:predicted nucleic acid-binding Zn ribbon protein
MKYECDDATVICPHCGASYQPEAEDYSEDSRDEECSSCGETYTVWQEFSVTHHTSANSDKLPAKRQQYQT